MGAVVISEALKNKESAERLAALLRQYVTRDLYIKEITTLLADLDAKAGKP